MSKNIKFWPLKNEQHYLCKNILTSKEYSGTLSGAQGITEWWSFGSPRLIQSKWILKIKW
jgi:hypothetical protein